jgi:hypothetical protein
VEGAGSLVEHEAARELAGPEVIGEEAPDAQAAGAPPADRHVLARVAGRHPEAPPARVDAHAHDAEQAVLPLGGEIADRAAGVHRDDLAPTLERSWCTKICWRRQETDYLSVLV